MFDKSVFFFIIITGILYYEYEHTQMFVLQYYILVYDKNKTFNNVFTIYNNNF